MRRGQGFFTTLLMIVPMTAVPVMAVFGIPQFVPAARSSPSTGASSHRYVFIESRVGQSDAPNVRNVVVPVHGLSDLFQPLDASASAASTGLSSSSGRGVSTGRNASGRQSAWTASADSATRQLDGATAQTRVSPGGNSAVEHRKVIQTGYRTADVATSQFSAALAESDALASVTANTSESVIESPDVSVRTGERYHRATRTGRIPTAPTDTPRRLTWREAVAELNAQGIHTFRLTPGVQPGTFQFSCLVSSVDDPRVSRWFDADATEPLDAVARVLSKVENWNQTR